MKKNYIRLGIAFLLTLVFLFFFFRSVEWNEVLNYLTDVDLKFFILIIVLVPVHLLTRSLRWRFLLIHEKKDVKFYNMFASVAVGFTVTLLFPGRIGELVRPLYLARKEKISRGFALGTVVVERIFDMFTMCFLLGIFLLAKPLYASFFEGKEETYSNLQLWGIIGVALSFFFLVIILSLYFFREKALNVISSLLKPLPERVSQKILKAFKGFIQGLKFFHSVANLLVYILLSFVVWIGIIFYYWIFFFAYKISVPFFLLCPYVFFVLIGASIPTPGMTGGFHLFSREGLTSLFDIDTNLAVGMTIVVHAAQVIVTCLVGYIILWKEGISLLQLKKLGEDAK
jgi:uncharacterized protein (TIRG00374 family)